MFICFCFLVAMYGISKQLCNYADKIRRNSVKLKIAVIHIHECVQKSVV